MDRSDMLPAVCVKAQMRVSGANDRHLVLRWQGRSWTFRDTAGGRAELVSKARQMLGTRRYVDRNDIEVHEDIQQSLFGGDDDGS